MSGRLLKTAALALLAAVALAPPSRADWQTTVGDDADGVESAVMRGDAEFVFELVLTCRADGEKRVSLIMSGLSDANTFAGLGEPTLRIVTDQGGEFFADGRFVVLDPTKVALEWGSPESTSAIAEEIGRSTDRITMTYEVAKAGLTVDVIAGATGSADAAKAFLAFCRK
jgi:hypothetical protein